MFDPIILLKFLTILTNFYIILKIDIGIYWISNYLSISFI
jgi:hypothetical protein